MTTSPYYSKKLELDEAKRLYYAYHQGEDEPNDKHLKNFKNLIEVIKHFGGDIFEDTALINHEGEKDWSNGFAEKHLNDYKTIMQNKMIAVGYLKPANTCKYATLMNNIMDQFTFNIDVYPTTLNSAYELLENNSSVRQTRPQHECISNYSGGRGHGCGRSTGRGRGRDYPPITGLQYAQHANNKPVVAGNDRRTKHWIICWKCQHPGNFVDF